MRPLRQRGERMTTRLLGLATAAAIFLADQLVKYWVLTTLDLRHRGQVVVNEIFSFTYVENHGVSLGFLTADTDAARWMLVALTAAISVGVLVWMFRETNRQDVLALGLILGGALGNIVDRARFGYVVDYADLHFGEFRPFLVFNVADAAITIGVVILLIRALLVREKPNVPEKVSADA
jgi:signal peptidase II